MGGRAAAAATVTAAAAVAMLGARLLWRRQIQIRRHRPRESGEARLQPAGRGGVVLFRGCPGVGKSHLVRRVIAAMDDACILRVSRDELWSHIYPRPRYDDAEKRVLDEAVLALVECLARQGHVVFVDGCTFASARTLDRFARAHARVAIIECDCAPETAEARLARDAGQHPVASRGPALYSQVRARFEAVAGWPVLRVDTGDEADFDATRDRVITFLCTREMAMSRGADA